MRLRALGEKVWVLEAGQAEKHLDGFWIPLKWRKPSCMGWIESIGPQAAKKVPELRRGMRVAFRPYSGTGAYDYDRVEYAGRRYRLLGLGDFIGIVGMASVEAL